MILRGRILESLNKQLQKMQIAKLAKEVRVFEGFVKFTWYRSILLNIVSVQLEHLQEVGKHGAMHISRKY